MRFRRETDAGVPSLHAGADDREFVATDVTPAAIVQLYDDYLSSEADKIVAPLVGKWLRVAGPRGYPVPRRRGVTLLRFDRRAVEPYTRVEMKFHGPDARQLLNAIPRGTEVVIVGTLASVTRSQVVLDHCEIESANLRSSPPP